MQERLISSRRSVHAQLLRDGLDRQGHAGLQELGPVRDQPMTLPRRSATRATRTSTSLGYAFYALPPTAAIRCRAGRAASASARRPGSTSARSSPASCRRPSGAQATFRRRPIPALADRPLWKPGDSIQLAIGQKDLLVTPLQMARFYALIANGGKLVTPHVVSASSSPAPKRRVPRYLTRRRRAERSRPGRARGRPRRALPGTHASSAPSTARLRQLPDPDRRQDGHGREGRRRCPATRPVTRRTSPGGAATGPYATGAEDRRLRADRERRPRRRGRRAGGAEGVRAVLRRQGDRRPRRRSTPTDGRPGLHRRPSGRAPGRAVAARAGGVAPRAGSTGCCSRRSLGIVAYGLWAIAGITRHDVAGSPTTTSSARSSSPPSGSSASSSRSLIDPGSTAASSRRSTSGRSLLFARLRRRHGRARLEALDRPRLLPLPAVRVREAAGRPRARRRSSPTASERSASRRTIADRRRARPPPILLVFLQPDFGTALVYGAALVAVLFFAGVALARTWRSRPSSRSCSRSRPLVAAVGRDAGAEALPAEPPDRLPRTRRRIRAGRLQHHAVDHRGRLGRPRRAAASPAPPRRSLDYLPEHATDFVFASLAEQRGFFGARFLLLLYLLVVWRGLKVVASARDAFAAIVAGGIVFAFLFQVFVNVGMTIGIAPVTGIPLPFVSVGGSSMVANLLAIGVLQAIHARGRGRGRGSRAGEARSRRRRRRCSACPASLRASARSDRPLVVSGPRAARLACWCEELHARRRRRSRARAGAAEGAAALVLRAGRCSRRPTTSACCAGVPGASAGRASVVGVDRRGEATSRTSSTTDSSASSPAARLSGRRDREAARPRRSARQATPARGAAAGAAGGGRARSWSGSFSRRTALIGPRSSSPAPTCRC